MLVYSRTRQDFTQDVEDGRLTEILVETIREKMYRNAPASEIKSWDNPLSRMHMALAKGVPAECGVAIEYDVPLTVKRVSYIISGHDDNGDEHADVTEPKQRDLPR